MNEQEKLEYEAVTQCILGLEELLIDMKAIKENMEYERSKNWDKSLKELIETKGDL